MCRVTFRCVKAWSFCELHQCVTTGAGDGVVHQQRLQLPMGKWCAFGRNVKLMRLACHKKEKWWEMSAVTPAKTRNDKEHTQQIASVNKKGLQVLKSLQIFGIARVKYSQVLSKSQSKSSELRATSVHQFNIKIGSTSCSGKSGHKTCEQEQEDIDRAIRWLRKRGQVVESVIQTATICPRKENSSQFMSLLFTFYGPFELTEKHPKVPINWNNRNRQGFCACRFWSVIEESWGSSRLVIQIVAAKHVQSTQW